MAGALGMRRYPRAKLGEPGFGFIGEPGDISSHQIVFVYMWVMKK
jgi:hypothetical protein